MITDNKYLKLSFKLFSLVSIIAVGVCFIVDFSISKHITWAAFPLVIIPFSWAIISPILLFAKNKGLYTIIAFSIVLVPLLFILERLTLAHGWFATLGLPLGVTAILSAWVIYAIVKFLKVSYWYLSAILVFFCGIVVSSVIRYFISAFLNAPFLNLDNIINLISCAAIVVLLTFIGQGKNKQRKES